MLRAHLSGYLEQMVPKLLADADRTVCSCFHFGADFSAPALTHLDMKCLRECIPWAWLMADMPVP